MGGRQGRNSPDCGPDHRAQAILAPREVSLPRRFSEWPLLTRSLSHFYGHRDPLSNGHWNPLAKQRAPPFQSTQIASGRAAEQAAPQLGPRGNVARLPKRGKECFFSFYASGAEALVELDGERKEELPFLHDPHIQNTLAFFHLSRRPSYLQYCPALFLVKATRRRW